jgi:hypothetical protein
MVRFGKEGKKSQIFLVPRGKTSSTGSVLTEKKGERTMSMKRLINGSMILAGCILALPLLAQGLTDRLQIHGFASQGYLKSTGNNFLAEDSKDGCMSYTEATLNVITSPAKNVNIGTQLYARDLDREGNLFVTLDWAYGDYRWKDFLGIRAGRTKMPMGLYGKVRDVDMSRIPLLLPQSVYAEQEREVNLAIDGVGIYGNFPIRFLGDFDYEAVYGEYNFQDSNSDFFKDQYALAGEPVALGMKANPAIVSASYKGASDAMTEVKNVRGLNLRWNTPLSGLMLGTSMNQLDFNWDFKANMDLVVPTGNPASPYYAMSQAIPILGDYLITTLNYYGEYQWKGITLAGEYKKFKIDGDVEINGMKSHTTTPREAFYGMASGRVNKWLALGTYYSMFYNNANYRDGADQVSAGRPAHFGWQKDLCFTTRLDITDNWLVKVEYHKFNGTGQTFPIYNPQGLKENWDFVAVKSTFYY